MKHESKHSSSRRRVSIADICTGLLAGVSLLLTMRAMDVYDAWSDGVFMLLMLLPCLLAFGLLGGLLIFHASARSRLALVTTTAILTAVTFSAYIQALADRPGGCMSGLIVLQPIAFSIGFPIVFGISWLLYGLNRNA